MVDVESLLALLPLLLVGTWAGVDGSAAGHFLLSRPLVSGALAGWWAGTPAEGFIIGALLEAYHLADLPMGGARLPEPGPAAVPAVALAARIGGPGGLALGVALGVLGSLVGGMSVRGQRRLNGWIMRPPEGEWHSAAGLSRRHWSCIGADALRSFLLTALGLAVALGLPATLGALWSLPESLTWLLLMIPGLLTGGTLLRRWRRAGSARALFIGGTLAGILLGLIR